MDIAQAYVQLQRAYLQLDIAEATLRQRDQIYALTRDRNAAGVDSLLEVKQAESALPATREQIAQWRESIELSRHQLAALLGQGPDRGLAIARPSASAGASVALPSALPAELLGRRPDLTAQRLRIEALSHDIASARAEFYPNVNLAAFVGLQSLGAAGFLTSASRMVGFGPAITLPIFDAGRLRGNLAAKNAGYDIAVEQYNQMLADALRDVVDQIASFRSVDEQRAAAGARRRDRPAGVRPRAAALSRRSGQLPAGADDRGAVAVAAEPRRGIAGAPACRCRSTSCAHWAAASTRRRRPPMPQSSGDPTRRPTT